MKVFRNTIFSVYVLTGEFLLARLLCLVGLLIGQRGLAAEVVSPPVALAICLYCTIIIAVLSSDDNSTDTMINVSGVMQSFLTT